MRFGDLDIIPLGLAVSRIDRLAWSAISKIDSSTSTLNAGNLGSSRTSKNLFVAHWDSTLTDFKCSDFAFDRPVLTAGVEADAFTRIALSTTNTIGKSRLVAVGTY